MATRLLLTAFAVLSALAALPASPAQPLLFEDAVGDVFDDVAEDLDSLSLDRDKRLNGTQIVALLQKALGKLEQRVHNVSDNVEVSVNSSLAGIKQATLENANRWNTTVRSWEEKANVAGVNVTECLAEEKALAKAEEGLRADSDSCTSKHQKDVLNALGRLRAVGSRAGALVTEAQAEVERCNKLDEVFAAGLCVARLVQRLQLQLAALRGQAFILSKVVNAKAATVGTLSSLCILRAGSVVRGEKIVGHIVGCIRSKLG